MVDDEKYFLSLKAKWMNTFLDDNFAWQWKIIESTVKTRILNCVISSDLNIECVQIKKLITFWTLRNLINTLQKLYSYACLCEPIKNKLLWLIKLIRLNNAVLYNEVFVNAEIVDYGHLINSTGEILDYYRATEKFGIPPNNSSFIELSKLCAALSSCWEKNPKIINYLITMTIYLLFDWLLTLLHFLQNGFIFVCMSLILWSQLSNKNDEVKI